MKRILVCVFALLLFCTTAFAAASPLTKEDLFFLYDGKTYFLGDDPSSLIAAIEAYDGEKMTVQEADSCQFKGKDREFTGKELILGTYPTGPKGADKLETIIILGGKWQTARGIGLGSTLKQVRTAYGEGKLDYDQVMYAMGTPYQSPTLIFVLDMETDTVAGIYLMACSA